MTALHVLTRPVPAADVRDVEVADAPLPRVVRLDPALVPAPRVARLETLPDVPLLDQDRR